MDNNNANSSIRQPSDYPNLSQVHCDFLRSRAISEAVIQQRDYQTVSDAKQLQQLGFSRCNTPGLLLPVYTIEGEIGIHIYKPDNPGNVSPNGSTSNGAHPYVLPKNVGACLDCPPHCRPQLANHSIPLWIVLGPIKADALASKGLCAIALLGKWKSNSKSTFGIYTSLADWDHIALKGRDIRIVFDGDLLAETNIQKISKPLIDYLQGQGASVGVAYIPLDAQKGRIGVDEWLALGHTKDELLNLVQAPKPAPQPAQDIVELLDDAPLTIKRPLTLLDGHAYASTWLHFSVTRSETLDKKGQIIQHNPPTRTNEKRHIIIRNDGKIFGSKKPLEELGVDIHLPEIPPDDRLWSARGVKSFAKGNRPNPLDVFNRIVAVIDKFIDFDRSLASQRTMAEAVACYVLSTWFLDAFNVTGFLWPTGDRGSGKTHLLLVVSELAYLGQLILAGGSFASLRDMADYGATLAFDDAENLSNSKTTDPDKRALLLAGNRRGVTVSLKEPRPDKTWGTRYVNAYCPRLFSAIHLPDPILASRTITIPLVRTPDRQRANADPLDHSLWPEDRQHLIDDLWALSIVRLPELPKWDKWVGENARLTGRNLQPWRAILAVAAWLDENGATGLFQRMEQLSLDYQIERSQLEFGDTTVLVIRALIEWAVANVAKVTNVANPRWVFTSSQITERANAIAKQFDGDFAEVISRQVGQVFRKMRLTKPPRPRGQNERVWSISPDELVGLAMAYSISVPDEISSIKQVDTPQEIGDIGNIGDIGDSPEGDDLYEGVI